MRALTNGIRTPHLTMLVMASASINTLALALPLMMMQIYNRILPGEAADTLFILSSAVIIAAAADFLLKMARYRLLSSNSRNFEVNAARLMIKRVFGAKAGTYEHYPAIKMMQDIQSIGRLKDEYTGMAIVTFLLDLPFIAIFFALITYLAGWISVIPAATLLVYSAMFRYHGHMLHGLIGENERQDDRRYNFITKALYAVHTIKSNCLEAITTRRFEALQSRSVRANYTASYLSGRIDILNSSLAQIMTITLITIGAPLVIEHRMTVGTLIATILIAGQIVQPFQRIATLWIRQQDSALAEMRVQRILDLPQTVKTTATTNPTFSRKLQIKDMRFSHRTGKNLFDDICLEIEAGTTVAIHGPIGTGKTSLLELICGAYQPDAGSITYSGTEVSSFSTEERVKNIAYLPTQGLILRGSIMENLTGFDTRLQQAAREISGLLGIDASVAMLPQGYDTQLEGMNTDVVSPGLRQRIAIARALIHRPQLILFDNADHGLDRESYGLVFNLLARLRGQATVILISEDKNITSLADQEWQLHNGNLIPLSSAPSNLIVGMAQ